MRNAKLLLAVSCMILARGAHAQSAGEFQVTPGWLHLQSRAVAGPLNVVNPPLGEQTNTGGVGSNPDTLAITLQYFVTDNIAAETWLGIPPKLKFMGTGNLSASGINPLVTARSWSPVVLFKYYLGTPAWKFRPYVGLGVMYKFDTDVRVNPAFQSAASLEFSNGATASSPSTAKFDPGFGPVFNVGATYNIDKHWSLNASLTYVHFSSKATIETHLPGSTVVATSKIRENPLVTFVGIGYRF
ncbi:OmpW/AlkL family protein [Paraburkholderia sp. D1E]|uniref:OmpW/AlkL family protein n=1 Tax=Paraburkholderia sp. D1E TaxID=3461398 RepID=UPI004045FC07